MRLIWTGIAVGVMAGSAAPGGAQGSWTPQASPSPAPPVYISPPAPPAPPPPSGKERAARPIGNPGSWVTNDAYPAESAKNGEQGTTAFRLMIDPAGMVTACHITNSSGFDRLDFAACELMQANGRFSPALDKKGKPTTGTWASRFKWVLPEVPEPSRIEPINVVQSFIVETDGGVTGCTMLLDGKEVAYGEDDDPCTSDGPYLPVVDSSGRPVRRKVTMTLDIKITDPDAPPHVAPAAKPPVQPMRRKQP